MMIEVFKTDVRSTDHASMLVGIIQDFFPEYRSNFDLQDCDRILRIVSADGEVSPQGVIDLLAYYGYTAEVLEDEIVSIDL